MSNAATYCCAMSFAALIRELTFIHSSAECAIDNSLYDILSCWQSKMFSAWSEFYEENKPDDINNVKECTIINCFNLKEVKNFIKYVYSFTGGESGKNIIFHLLLRAIYKWENKVFEEWKAEQEMKNDTDFNFNDCEVTETPFMYNGTAWVNVCLRSKGQEINYEFRQSENTDCQKGSEME